MSHFEDALNKIEANISKADLEPVKILERPVISAGWQRQFAPKVNNEERDKNIVAMYHVEHAQTLRSVAKIFGISYERVRHIIAADRAKALAAGQGQAPAPLPIDE